jgi:hypothetical protein
MKKYSILLLAFLLFSCDDFLKEDPKGQLSAENFFTSKSDLDMSITALYGQFQNLNQQPGRALYAYAADDVTAQNSGNKTRFAEYDMFNFTSGNTELGNWYSYLYATIKACNYIINNAARTPADESFINARLGQAYLIRAYCYFNLVRIWGNIAIVTKVEINYDAQKSAPADVYALIESDCVMAEKMLPIKQSVVPYFQNGINVAPGKGAAKALLASVYMTEAGWPLKKGAAYYDKAAEKYKEIIDNESEYGYILEPKIIDLTVETTGNYSKEIVWGAFYNINQQSYMGCLSELPEETSGWCDLLVEIEFFNSMPDGPRKDAWILKDICLLSKKDAVTGNPVMVPWNSAETNQQHPHWRKNVDNGKWNYKVDANGQVSYTNAGLAWNSGRTKFIFRYADILLLYAEAKAFGSSSPDNLAYTCINRVRERAGLNDIHSMSTTEFQKAILDERRWETAGMEHGCMSRFFTMQRHEILHKQKEYRSAKDNPITRNLTLSEKDYYFPIPDREILIVPQME